MTGNGNLSGNAGGPNLALAKDRAQAASATPIWVNSNGGCAWLPGLREDPAPIKLSRLVGRARLTS